MQVISKTVWYCSPYSVHLCINQEDVGKITSLNFMMCHVLYQHSKYLELCSTIISQYHSRIHVFKIAWYFTCYFYGTNVCTIFYKCFAWYFTWYKHLKQILHRTHVYHSPKLGVQNCEINRTIAHMDPYEASITKIFGLVKATY